MLLSKAYTVVVLCLRNLTLKSRKSCGAAVRFKKRQKVGPQIALPLYRRLV